MLHKFCGIFFTRNGALPQGGGPHGAASRFSSAQTSAEIRRGGGGAPGHPLDVRPIHFAYVTGILGKRSWVWSVPRQSCEDCTRVRYKFPPLGGRDPEM